MRTRQTGASLWAVRVLLFVSCLFVHRPGRAGDLDVSINEIFYHPPVGLEDAEFVELHNRGNFAVDLSGWRITGGITAVIPGSTSIPPGGYLLVVKSPLLASLLYAGTARVGGFSGRLSDGGDRLRLETAGGVLVEEFDYGDDDGWPEGADGTGASLEKRAPGLDPWRPDSWAASSTLLGSPGTINTQFRELVPLPFVAVGESWRYLKGLAEPTAVPGAWTHDSFDDSLWQSGPTGIGYGDGDDATILDDMPGLYSTVYLRKSFSVADPAAVQTLTFRVDYDDGFVLWLNGAEVARRNAPGAPGTVPPFDAFATGLHEAGTPETIDLTGSRGLLVAGRNTLAIQVLNRAIDSSDLSMLPALEAEVMVSGIDTALERLVPSEAIARGAVWSYFPGAAEPSATPGDWTAATFDDSAWATGAAGFGYGDGDDTTVLADMRGGYSTLYVRATFEITDLASLRGLLLGIDHDDGFIAWLNGVEVARADAPGALGEFPPHDATAPASHEAGTEATFDLSADLDLVVAGTNVLAVQGFNSSLTSSDFSLHPRLTVLNAQAGDPAALRAGVSVNELQLASGADPGWIEIHNDSTDPVDLAGFGLSTDGSRPSLSTFPSPTILPAGGFLTVDEAELGFALPPAGTVLLTDGSGIVLVDGFTYSVSDPALPAGLHPDGRGEVELLSAPTPGAPNAAPPDFGVVINEIMYHPSSDPAAEESEWIELHNPGPSPVDLTGWAFTRGIDYALPAGTVIAPGGFLVVARTPAAVSTDYGIAGVIGGFTSRLRNDDELIVLRDHLGNTADRVHYADDGRWPAACDGSGPSAELLNPALDNRTGMAWAASDGSGTPGAANDRRTDTPPPIVRRLRHFPPVPRADQSVTITLDAEGLSPIASVRLFHRVTGDPAFAMAILADDGVSGDGAAGDGRYGGSLPPQPSGRVIEFYAEVEDTSGNVRVVPSTAPAQNALYQVDEGGGLPGVPLYRIVMTPEDRFELETRDAFSDELLNATFIAGDVIRYRVGVRYRGKSSRLTTPKSYRVEFTDDEEFEGIAHLNLNGHNPEQQHLGMLLFHGADVPSSLTRPVRLKFSTDPELTYTRMEKVGQDFLRRVFSPVPGDDDGNLYRGIETGNLDYRGPDAAPYRPSYEKVTGEARDDWSDLIALCDALTNTPADQLVTLLPTLIDVDEWTRFFAAHTVLSTQEGSIYRDKGDDYFLYRRPSDGRWLLVPWDLDEGFRNPAEPLFRPTLPQIRRVLENPAWSPLYYRHVVELAATHFAPDRVAAEAAELSDLFPAADLAAITTFVPDRDTFIASSVETEFTARLEATSLVAEGDLWSFHRGVAEPSGGTLDWTLPGFDDSGWESGPTGIGYGDGDDATLLDDMQNSYSTVYARRVFTVADPGELPSIELAIDYDDGFIAYLNGTEIARANAGAAGTVPAFDSFATTTHEAGTFETYRISNASSLLVAGDNTLAVMGLNATIDSTDFSSIPTLRTGGVVATGCAGESFVTGDVVRLAGTAPVTLTYRVTVGGDDAMYDPRTGEWSWAAPLTAPTADLEVAILDVDSLPVATETIRVRRITTLGGTIAGHRSLEAASGPFLVTSPLTVAATGQLDIGPGCELLLADGVPITVRGRLQAIGTEAAPIVLTRMPCHAYWGAVLFDRTREDNILRHVELSRAATTAGCLTVRGSNLEVTSCHIHDIDGEGITASGSTIDVRSSLIERTHEVVGLDFCRTNVEFNLLRNGRGKADLVDANGSNNPPAHIAYNTMYGTSDDGIDADRGSVFAEGNIIHDCRDQAASLVGSGNSLLERNLFYHCGIGLAVKDSHVCTARFNTIVDNATIGVRGIQKNAGRGGGIVFLENSIVWGNPTPLFVNSTGSITTTYTDVDGPDPVPGEGNIQLDPLFVDAAARDYRLQAASPCRGAASDGDDLGAIPFEITPRAPSALRLVRNDLASVDLAWNDNSFVEEAFELERRASQGFVPLELVPLGAPWRFFRGRAEPSAGSTDWTAVGFDDSAWEEGPTGIGYGDGDDATVLSDMRGRYTTLYLRKTFVIADASLHTALELLIDWDDGFVAWLNSSEIARRQAGSPGSFLPFDSLAAEQREAGETVAIEIPVTGILASGENVFAIQVLNATLTSSDLSIRPVLRTIDETPFAPRATLGPNVRTFEDSALAGETSYSWRVRAVNSSGVSAYSNVVSVETSGSPAAPDGLAVTGVGPDFVSLSWLDHSATETAVEVERAIAGGEFERVASLPPDSTSHTDSALTPGETYHYRVRATNVFGSSAYSNTVTQVTGDPPSAPADLAVTAVRLEGLDLGWTDTSDDETAFELQIRPEFVPDFQLRARLPAGATTYADVDLLPDTDYTYRARAVNAVGPSAWSAEVTARTGRLPPTPADLTILHVGLDTLDLAWLDESPDEEAFDIERRGPDDAEFAPLATVGAGVTSHSDTGLAPGTTYQYRIRASNVFGSSDWSAVVTGETGRLPGAPTGLSITAIGLDRISTAWVDTADNESAFELERADPGGPFVLVATLPADSAAHDDLGLPPGTDFVYRVRAVNEFGASAYSAELPAETGRRPAAPSDLLVASLGHDSVSFTWTDNADNETGFEVERSDSGGPFAPIASLSVDASAYRDTGLAPARDYAYRVTALGLFGRSAASAPLAITTGRLPEAPGIPFPTAIGADTVTLEWADNSDNETGFDIERRNAGGVFTRVARVDANITVWSDSGLEPGTDYVYRVVAVGEFGPSAPSPERSVTTKRLPQPPLDLRATEVSLTSITLAWTDSSDNETGFTVQRRDPGGVFRDVATLDAGSTEYRDPSLASGVEYEYRVVARGEFGDSEPSAPLLVATGHLPDPPEAVRVLEALPTRVRVAWLDASDDETGFTVERRAAGAAEFELLATLPAGTETILDAEVEPGGVYDYRVKATNGFGASAWSEIVSARTSYPPPEIDAIAPSESPIEGGIVVTITGTEMIPGSRVLFGETEAEEVEVLGDTELSVTVPPGALGIVDVTVTTEGGSATRAGAFTYFEQYRRGDVNADGTLDISDAIGVLNFLFLGGDPPPCDDVANANADDDVDLSDPVFILRHLFLGGEAPEPVLARCDP